MTISAMHPNHYEVAFFLSNQALIASLWYMISCVMGSVGSIFAF